jgi:predicted transcriptional regulator
LCGDLCSQDRRESTEISVSESSAKQRVLEAVQGLPEDATVEDAIERLYFLAKVERGLEDARSGRTVSHEEVRRRFLG